jgi:hypothetical protein
LNKGSQQQAIIKEVGGIHVLVTRSLFGGGIPRRLLLHVSLAKPTSAPQAIRFSRITLVYREIRGSIGSTGVDGPVPKRLNESSGSTELAEVQERRPGGVTKNSSRRDRYDWVERDILRAWVVDTSFKIKSIPAEIDEDEHGNL